MEVIRVSSGEIVTPQQVVSKPKYVPLTEGVKAKVVEVQKPKEIVRSKVLVIEKLSITITQNFDEDVDFVITSEPGVLSDHKTIPFLDITAKEEIVFDEDITLAKLEKIIRRCGILERYEPYFTNDPEIVINEYELIIKKKYKFFNEFKDGVLIANDIIE